jgi:signal transduction histidine kinase/HPt (histidine-containing phosphotransfer) domain-containing protein
MTGQLDKVIKVLVVQADWVDRGILERMLVRLPHLSPQDIRSVETLAEADHYLRDQSFDVVFVDLNLRDASGSSVLDTLVTQYPDPGYILIASSEDEALRLPRVVQGEMDYLITDQFDHHLLSRALGYTLHRRRVQKDLHKEKKCGEGSYQLLEQMDVELETALEQASLLAREAEAADYARTRFLANISHEIRTPMNAIMGFSELLSEEPLSTRQQEFVQIIRRASEELLDLINRILDLTQIEARQYEVSLVPSDVRAILDSLERLYGPKAKAKGLAFTVAVKGAVPERVRTDPAIVRQSLVNLVDNAVKFTLAGSVSVEVTVGRSEERDVLQFDVKDTGVGIAPDRKALLFEPFSQADPGSTRRFGGAGLGLAMSRKLIGLIGGRLDCATQAGQGSIFSVKIPLDAEAAAAPQVPVQVQEPRGAAKTPAQIRPSTTLSGRVLVAEDSRTNASLVQIMLKRLGLEVGIAVDGQKAVERVLSEHFDLVLMDIQMPNMDGLEATQTLRAKGVTIPILALTASALEGDREQCLAAGCNAYMSKPFQFRTLEAVLREYLSSKDEAAQPAGKPPIPATEEGSSVLDMQLLHEIYDRPAIIQEIVEAFLQEAPQTLDRVVAAVGSRNTEDRRSWAHKLKGSALTIAAQALADSALRLEQASTQVQPETLDAMLQDLQGQWGRLRSFLDQPDWLDQVVVTSDPCQSR